LLLFYAHCFYSNNLGKGKNFKKKWRFMRCGNIYLKMKYVGVSKN